MVLGEGQELGSSGSVRPRYTDGTCEEPFLLEDRFAELFLAPDAAPCHLYIDGERGSGLSTALAVLARAAERAGRAAVTPGFLLGKGAAAYHSLASEAILFVDESLTPLDNPARAWKRELERPDRRFFRELLGDASIVVARHPRHRESAEAQIERGVGPARYVRLAPWSRDDILELMAADRYREHRGRVQRAFAALPRIAHLLARPRTARWMVDAAIELGPDEEVTLSRLYANFLDVLEPDAIELVKAAGDKTLRKETVAAAFKTRPGIVDEVVRLFLVERHVEEKEKPFHHSRLALDGLNHFIEAGAIVRAIATDESLRVPADETLPFLAEMLTPALRETLRACLAAESERGFASSASGEVEGAAAATILWACGETPRFNAARVYDLGSANLEGLRAPGIELGRAILDRANLRGTFLEKAKLHGARFVKTTLDGACLDGAVLDETELVATQLVHASLRQASLVRSRLGQVAARHACFEGADLSHALLCDLHAPRADFSGARLTDARVSDGDFEGASFLGADLTGARFSSLAAMSAAAARTGVERALLLCFNDVTFARATLSGANLRGCNLSGLDLSEVTGIGMEFDHCDLSSMSFANADLPDTCFSYSWAHEANFEGADLRGATFGAVNFHAGSSRAGLLIGKPALEGNKTGFYAEGTTDDAWNPDLTTHASFRGADLRGATFRDTDVFRVDFRGAELDDDLRAQLLQGGAILD